MTSLLPSHDGLLPYFLLYTSISALAHSLVCYLSPPTTSIRVFSGPARPQLTPLLARTYAVKNVYTGLIRGVAAYHVASSDAYYLALASFAGVVWLYGTECFYYRTVGFDVRGAWIPLVQAGAGVVWMVVQRGWYLG